MSCHVTDTHTDTAFYSLKDIARLQHYYWIRLSFTIFHIIIFRNVKFILGSTHFFRCGSPWYQKELVGFFMSKSIPSLRMILTSSIPFFFLFWCLKIKSLSAPKVRLAMGTLGSSSFSSSLWSPILSFPSLYLLTRTKLYLQTVSLVQVCCTRVPHLTPAMVSSVSLSPRRAGVQARAGILVPL